MHQRPTTPSLALVRRVWALSLVTLAACSTAEAPLPSTQIAAKVGSEEISLHQVNVVLAQSRTTNATPEQTQVRSRAVLENLIEQQLAVDQAIQAKLDRSPDVMAQVDAARPEVLASAYMRQFVSALPKPDVQAVRDYYVQHPALFAERRIFNIQEIVTAQTPDVLAQVQGMAAANKPLDDVAAWLKARNIPFAPGAATRAAEQIPLEFSPRMHALQDGHNAVFTNANAITVLRLVASRTAPIDEPAALPRIEQYLGNLRTSEAIAAHMQVLRDQTTVAYQGAFVPPAKPLTPTSPADVAVPAPVALGSPIAPASTTMEKGLAGLK